jgi:hypothetical protein
VGAAVSCTAFLKFGRLYDPALVAGKEGEGRTLYDRKSMLTLEREIPVVVDHDLDQRIGVVRWIDELPDTDGSWYAALTEITHPPPWLKRGTRVSFCSRPFQRSEYNGWQIVRRAILEELSVLSPGVRPVEPCAQVLRLERSNGAPRSSSSRLAPGAVVLHNYSDAEVEAMIAAADRRRAQPGRGPDVLVRRNVGQVLGVR